ncbi:MAG: 2-C-methyl-D-erythritol 4-phosphate cytidylyltransferase [Immundisolibacteraceae bacterium]|nr:2-C-methyl-D-erythritol 4-phosphate cytidylyltransferase [Immundisolibacteraceae bacterium]
MSSSSSLPTDAEIWAVIPAAGSGSRMAAGQPKQYLLLDGKPLLYRTLQRLACHSAIVGMVVALDQHDSAFKALELAGIEAQLKYPLLTVSGGATRSESVANAAAALVAISAENSSDMKQQARQSIEQPWVMVHDAARPCVRHSDLDQLIEQVDDQGGLLSLEVTDTLWQQDEQGRCQHSLPREQLRRALTPQLFPLRALVDALAMCHQQNFLPTDEAQAMVYAGYRPKLVSGAADNIKVTRPGDLELASQYLRQQNKNEAS